MDLQSLAVPTAKTKKPIPMYPVVEGWPALVRKLVTDKGVQLKDVAKAGGIKSQTLSGLLKGKYRHSIAIPKINAYLGIEDADHARAASLLSQMNSEARAAWLAVGEQMAKATPPPESSSGKDHTAGMIANKMKNIRDGLTQKKSANDQPAVVSSKGGTNATNEVGAERRRPVPGRS